MKTIYEKYMASPIDKELLCLEHGEITEPYFCYPVNAEPIGFEGCILYCFLPEYGEMVFACDPESCADRMDKRQFEEHMEHEEKILTQEQRAAVQQLQREMGLLPIETPFEYVKAIQKDFDDSKIQYSDEYYEVTGREAPKETDTPNKTLLEFQTVTVEVRGQNDRV